MVLMQSRNYLLSEDDCEDEIYTVHVFSKIDTTAESFIVLFFTRRLTTVILMKRVMPSPDRKMIKLLSFNKFPSLRHSR